MGGGTCISVTGVTGVTNGRRDLHQRRVVVGHHDGLEATALRNVVALNEKENNVLATLADGRVLPRGGEERPLTRKRCGCGWANETRGWVAAEVGAADSACGRGYGRRSERLLIRIDASGSPANR